MQFVFIKTYSKIIKKGEKSFYLVTSLVNAAGNQPDLYEQFKILLHSLNVTVPWKKGGCVEGKQYSVSWVCNVVFKITKMIKHKIDTDVCTLN